MVMQDSAQSPKVGDIVRFRYMDKDFGEGQVSDVWVDKNFIRVVLTQDLIGKNGRWESGESVLIFLDEIIK